MYMKADLAGSAGTKLRRLEPIVTGAAPGPAIPLAVLRRPRRARAAVASSGRAPMTQSQEIAVLDISGKWVLLTGASRGIGRQVAGALADRGCHLILHSRKREHTAALVAELQARGLTVHALDAELSDQTQVVALGKE